MKTIGLYSTIFLLVSSFIFSSCNKSKTTLTCDGTVSTYNSNIKSIIDASCTESSCHPAYKTYDGIKSVLNSGAFKSQVLTNQSMPRGSKLSSDQLNKIQCWADAGFPEK